MKTHLNLIPVSVQRRRELLRMRRAWSTAVSVTGAICAGVCLALWTGGVAAVHRLQALESRYAPIGELVSEQIELTELVDDLHARERLTIRLSAETHGLSLLGAVSEAARDLGGNVYVESLAFEGGDSSARRPNDEAPTLQLEGAGLDSLAVASFASGLRESGLFSEVIVKSTQPIANGGPDEKRFHFEIGCTL